MAVSETEFAKLHNINATAEVACRNTFHEIAGVKIQVKGIVGGRGRDAKQTHWYHVFVDVETIRADEIPEVFILGLSDDRIKHVNIFHPGFCAPLGCDLPHVCWGEYRSDWRATAKHNRTLVGLVKRLETLLSNQNFDSPAR